MVRDFAEHFSRLAEGYAEYRPRYPEALFAAIAAASTFRERAWDCATGTGQAAQGLVMHFQSVVASDASPEQLRAASPHPRIRYVVAQAEAAPLASRSVGTVTVAQALHWLDLPRFYAEARRILRPGGLVVVWTYGNLRVDGGAVDEILRDFYARVIGPYWAPERRWVETGYRTLRFPFDELAMEPPEMSAEWNLAQLLGYVGTWSAVARCREVTGSDPLAGLAEGLKEAWGASGDVRRIHWPIGLRAGR